MFVGFSLSLCVSDLLRQEGSDFLKGEKFILITSTDMDQKDARALYKCYWGKSSSRLRKLLKNLWSVVVQPRKHNNVYWHMATDRWAQVPDDATPDFIMSLLLEREQAHGKSTLENADIFFKEMLRGISGRHSRMRDGTLQFCV